MRPLGASKASRANRGHTNEKIEGSEGELRSIQMRELMSCKYSRPRATGAWDTTRSGPARSLLATSCAPARMLLASSRAIGENARSNFADRAI